MKTSLRYAAAELGLALMTMAAAVPPSVAQVPKNFPPRYLTDQQTTYTRFMVNFNSCQVTVATPCSFKVGAIPYNTFLLRGWMQVYQGFTGATTMTASIGTTSGSANIVASTSILVAASAQTLTITPTSLGTGNTAGAPPGVTGNGAIQTGANGGFDLWVTLTTTVAVPTAGQAVMILEYVLPNDGACTTAPTTPSGTGVAPPNC
jgi:hypothetical protein